MYCDASKVFVFSNPFRLASFSGSSCVPLETKFKIENVNETTQKVKADWIPITVSQFELARFKLSFLGTVAKSFERETFELIAKIDNKECSDCIASGSFETTNSIFYQVNTVINNKIPCW